MSQDRINCIREGRPAPAQFRNPPLRHLFEKLLSAAKQRYKDAPVISSAVRSTHVSMLLHSVDKLHGGVVLQSQPLGQRPDRRTHSAWESANRKQQKIMLRLETHLYGGRIRLP
jgi:hypothetical protein